MTGDQVLKLLESGFTAEEIRKMQEPVPEPPKDPQPETQQEQEPEPERQQETAPEPQKEPSETDKRLDALENSISKLVKTLQESNLKNSSYNSDPAVSLEEQTDRIMAGIIRPEHNNKGKE